MTTIEIERTNTTPCQIPGRRNAFDVLGVDTSAQETVTDVMADAGLLGWNVRLRAMETVATSITPEGVTTHPDRLLVPGAFAVIRDNPKADGAEQVIGTVGKKFVPKQNEELVGFMWALVESTGAPITRAADYYGNGKQVFFSIELPADVLVNGVDLLSYNLAVFTGHDGSLAITPVISQLRPFCANQKNIAIAGAASFAKIRHTSGADAKMDIAQHLLGIGLKTIKKENEKADILANKTLTDTAFDEIVKQVWPLESAASTRMKTMHERRNESLKYILHGPTNANIDGTAWAGLQTITEYLQHSSEKATLNAQRAMRSVELGKLADRAERLLLSV